MLLAHRTLFVAGPYGDATRSMDSFTGKRGGRLAAFSADHGQLLSNWKLDALPVFDGLAAAQGQLFMSLQDGSVRCFGAQGQSLDSAVSDAIEVLPEELLASDSEYRREVRERLGKPLAAGNGANGQPLPGGAVQPVVGEDLANDFSFVSAARVVKGPLGYRVAADKNEVALVLHQLETPVRSKSAWEFKIEAADGFPNPPYFQNGFIALGDGVNDEQLIKCGLQFVQSVARIQQGPTSAAGGVSEKISMPKQGAVTIKVVINFTDQLITMSVGGHLCECQT